MTVAAILFDFDGTIVDTETADYQSWQELFAAHGLELSLDLWRERVGKVIHPEVTDVFHPYEYFEKVKGRPLSADELHAQETRYLDMCKHLPILPGVIEMLEAAKAARMPLAIASNSDYPWVERWAKHYKVWDYFTCVFTREMALHPKPAPELYLKAANCLGVDPSLCVVFEDSPIGMQAAMSAGMRCFAIPTPITEKLPRPQVTRVLNSLAELPFERLITDY